MNSSSLCSLSVLGEGRWMDSSDVNKISTNWLKRMTGKTVMLHMSLWICQPLSVWSAVTWLYIHSLDPDLWITAHVLRVHVPCDYQALVYSTEMCMRLMARHAEKEFNLGYSTKHWWRGSLQQSGLVWYSHQIVKQRSRVYFSSLCCRGFPAVWSNCVKILLLMSVSS